MGGFKKRWTLDREKFMSEEEVKKLRRVCEDKALADIQKGRTTWPRFWIAIDLAVNAGLRVSEITNLKVGNLYLNSKEPRLRVTGKGDKTRDVYISKVLFKHLTDYLKWKRTLNEPTGDGEFLLLSSHGRKYSTRTLQYAFKRAAKITGLPEYYSIHACRHSYGTYLYKKTKDLRLVQKLMGHSDISTTTIYSDVTVDAALEGVNGLYESEEGDD